MPIIRCMKYKLSAIISMICLCLFSGQRLKSQSVIHGSIKNPDSLASQFANVLLLNSSDSSLVKGTMSDVAGKYRFENITSGEYLVSATSTGMYPVYSPLIKITTAGIVADPGILYLKHVDVQLNSVTVTFKKPMFEQKTDRMVINVKNSIIDAGGTALEVLEKSPGVTINRQNSNIALNGKNGVTVMINGRISYMPTDALVQLGPGVRADRTRTAHPQLRRPPSGCSPAQPGAATLAPSLTPGFAWNKRRQFRQLSGQGLEPDCRRIIQAIRLSSGWQALSWTNRQFAVYPGEVGFYGLDRHEEFRSGLLI